MKRIILTLFVFYISHVIAQTTIFSENFDGATVNMTSSSTGAGSWSLNTNFQTSGTSSDSAQVQLGDTVILESNAFSTMGFSFLSLQFSQICKIDFFDRAKLEYSIDNGITWVGITTSNYNGSGNFVNNSFSSVSYSIWNPGTGTATPIASWWQNETFNLNAAANQMQVKVRFLLIDADNNGARNNYGWLLDDLAIIGSPCELVPPTISYTGTIYQGSTFGTGPYTIEADIQDASGINSATLTYTVNNGAANTLTMTNSSGNIYQAIIPSANVNDTICYLVTATDNTTCTNTASNPSTGCTQFFINPAAPPNCLGNPVSNFNYSETFATFTPGTGQNNGGAGTLNNNWQNASTNNGDWWVYNQGTRSNGTGPTADHSPGDANYMYIEASTYRNQTISLITPCYNFGGLLAPKFTFWYHMNGTAMGDLHVDIHNGNNWILDVTPAIIGTQGNQWNYREIALTQYAGQIVQLRFRGITANGFSGDIAIDDIEILEPIPLELALNTIVSPSSSTCNGSAMEQVTVKVENLGSTDQDTIPLAYQVNGGTIVRDTAFFNLTVGSTFNHTFQPTFDMSATGTYSMNAWVELPNDGNTSNDSLRNVQITTNTISTNFPDTVTFDNYSVGTLNGVWRNDPANVFDWAVSQGGTPSGQTGPTGDTTSPAGTGKYVYYEATNVPQGEEGSFFSNCLDLSNVNKPELKFNYHMSGIEMGSLHLDLNLNGFLIQDIIPAITGNQGAAWLETTVDLTPYKGNVRVIFRATRGSGYRSDIAVDQIRLRDAMPLTLEEIGVSESFTVYPNPFKENIAIHLKEQSKIIVRNVTGAVINNLELKKGNQTIDMSLIPKGIYFISVENSSGFKTEKIIKQ